jgi:preprotein translocase subunit SecD
VANRALPARRYFGALVLVIAAMFGLIFFTGTERTPQLGLDLRGGTTVTLTARTPDGQAPVPEDLELARRIIEQRVNGLGVRRGRGGHRGDTTSSSPVPGTTASRPASWARTAQLRFRPSSPAPSRVCRRPSSRRGPAGDAAPTDAAPDRRRR